MTWYAIRTAPGAQMPQREYAAETTKSDKGYRIVRSLDPNVSAIERSLSRLGFKHYMPVDYRVVRDRKRTNVWHKRRFALLLGYVFVEDVVDWQLLQDKDKSPGVASVVRSLGIPMPIPQHEMDFLRTTEAESAEIAEAKLVYFKRMAEEKDRYPSQRKAISLFPKGTVVRITKGFAQHMTGSVTGTDREGRLKLLVQSLEMSVPMDSVMLEAAE